MYLKDWMKHIVHLLSSSPLEIFDISSIFVGLSFNSLVEDEFICVQCTKLEILSVFVDPDDVIRALALILLRLEGLVFQNINILRTG